jgi:hypothetical protein
MRVLKVTGLAVALVLTWLGTAQALGFHVDEWTDLCPANCLITSPTQQALPTNSLQSSINHAVFDFTQASLNLIVPTNDNTTNTNHNFFSLVLPTISGFSGTGSYATQAAWDPTILSTGSYNTNVSQTTTLMRIIFTIAGPSILDITHDDGVSLFASGDTTTNFLPTAASAPTSVDTDTTPVLPGGTYDLWYVEGNGSPSVLSMTITPIPEPGTIALVGTALLGIGMSVIRWRRKVA